MRIEELLVEGDLRTTGRAEEVVQKVLAKPELLDELVDCLGSENPGVRMRAADALEKIGASRRDLIVEYKDKFIKYAASADQQEVQWHLAQILGYLPLTPAEQEKVIKILGEYIDTTKSNIVKVFSLQTMADIAKENLDYRKTVVVRIKETMKNGKPSVQTRGKKLLKELED